MAASQEECSFLRTAYHNLFQDIHTMKSLLPTLIMLLIPSVSWAHPGHGAVGLFHHLSDVAPLILLAAIVAGYAIWVRSKR